MGSHAKGFDGVKIVDGLHLKGHKLRTHLPHLFAVVSLLLDHKPRHEEKERRAGKRDHRHHPVIVQDHEECRDKIVDRNDDRREPADRIPAHGPDIAVKPVQDIAV